MEVAVALALIGMFGTITSTLLSVMLKELTVIKENTYQIQILLASKADQGVADKIKERVNRLKDTGSARR